MCTCATAAGLQSRLHLSSSARSFFFASPKLACTMSPRTILSTAAIVALSSLSPARDRLGDKATTKRDRKRDRGDPRAPVHAPNLYEFAAFGREQRRRCPASAPNAGAPHFSQASTLQRSAVVGIEPRSLGHRASAAPLEVAEEARGVRVLASVREDVRHVLHGDLLERGQASRCVRAVDGRRGRTAVAGLVRAAPGPRRREIRVDVGRERRAARVEAAPSLGRPSSPAHTSCSTPPSPGRFLRSSVFGFPNVVGVISEHATRARTPTRATAVVAATMAYRPFRFAASWRSF